VASNEHCGGAPLRFIAPPRVEPRPGAPLGVGHLHQRRPPRRRGHGAAERLRGRGVLDSAVRARAAAPEPGLIQLAVHHVLDAGEQRAEQHRERGDRGVRPRVPPLRAIASKVQVALAFPDVADQYNANMVIKNNVKPAGGILVTWNERFLRKRAWTCLKNLARPRARRDSMDEEKPSGGARTTTIDVCRETNKKKRSIVHHRGDIPPLFTYIFIFIHIAATIRPVDSGL
jgi:hypothetical protein